MPGISGRHVTPCNHGAVGIQPQYIQPDLCRIDMSPFGGETRSQVLASQFQLERLLFSTRHQDT